MKSLLFLMISFPLMSLVYSKASSKKNRKPSSDVLLDYIPCEGEVFNTLLSWGNYFEWRKDLSFENVKSVKASSDKVGHWFKLKVEGDITELKKITPESVVVVTFEKTKCAKATSSVYVNKNSNDSQSFSDAHLSKILIKSKETGSKGVIYSWSPSMNLSKRGVSELRNVAKQLKIDAHIVHDPADKNLSPGRYQIKRSMRINSIELKERNFMLHYPSLIYYSAGRLEEYARPGYDSMPRLKKYLQSKVDEE